MFMKRVLVLIRRLNMIKLLFYIFQISFQIEIENIKCKCPCAEKQTLEKDNLDPLIGKDKLDVSILLDGSG